MKNITKKIESIPFTKDGYDKLKKEKQDLLVQRVDALEHLKKAREMGDLRENGYYKASRQKLNFIDGRLRRIEHLLRYGVIISAKNRDYIDIGSKVLISDGTRQFTYTIVGSEESNPSLGTISHKSPLGSILIGKKVHDTVRFLVPAGEKTYTVINIF